MPDSLNSLLLGFSFSQPLDYLPKNLKHIDLIIATRFKLPLDYLPLSLYSLILHGRFLQPLDHLPPSLKILQLGEEEPFHFMGKSYPHSLDNLPSSLQNFSLFYDFSYPTLHLPSSLQSFSCLFYGPLSITFPDSLRIFKFKWGNPEVTKFLLPLVQSLPPNITLKVMKNSLFGNDLYGQ